VVENMKTKTIIKSIFKDKKYFEKIAI
jgi:hypothetical protein